MFLAAAHTLASRVTITDLQQGSLYPPLTKIRDVSVQIAVAVAQIAYQHGLASKPQPTDLLECVREQMYDPHYLSYI